MSLLDSLPHRCTIFKETFSKGDLGGSKATRVDEQTGVECWEQNAGHGEIEEYEKRGISISHKIYFDSDPGVTERHRIVITSRDAGVTQIASSSQKVLEVRSVSEPDAGAGLGPPYKVMVERRTGTSQ